MQETEKPSLGSKLLVESFTGPVTKNEITAFKAHIRDVKAPASADGNVYVYGNPGKVIEACGLMYEITNDQEILDRMIYYCDNALAGRNDLATATNGGQRVVWTGKIEPVWPPSKANISPAGAGIEQGSVLAHMLYSAKLILSNPAIWNKKVSFGDSKGFGLTYKERALTYVKQSDFVIENWILPYFVRKDKKFYFPDAPNTYKPKEAAPWNQLFMLTNGLIRLSQCHILLNDAQDKVKLYDELITENINWFKRNVKSYTSSLGTNCWIFDYALVSRIEDTNHFAYESEGMWLAYDAAKYGVTKADMMAMANTYFDVVLANIQNGRFAGNVDGTTGKGHAGGDNYVRDEYIYLAAIRPEKYETVGKIEQSTGKIATSPQITARLLWLKDRRFKTGE
ncbi:alpha-1,2-mannosidase [Pedobacter boryungensis]|uniref:Alpha-1,2-mannosidase n=1 Tax=Pedobacter boryungensis TaxID=869962 RepID=A0ABX2DDJ7_9SPHI|nr:alpha-1,2-mannosidase [Pedobacter boryungensis]